VSAPIFISYSSKDQNIAETIYRALEGRGHDCWIACRDVAPGDNYQEAIVRALRAAKVMLLVFTSNANNSDEIKKELVLAGRHRITVVPVRVEDVIPNDAFTYELATRQWIDLFTDWERQIGILAARLGDILQNAKPGESGAEVAAIRPPRPGIEQPPSNRPLLWVAALVAVLLVGGGGAFLMRSGASRAPAALPSSAAAQMTPAGQSPPALMAARTPPAAPPAVQQPPAPVAAVPAPLPAPAPRAQREAYPAAEVEVQAAAPPARPAAAPITDESAWQEALSAHTIAALNGFLKAYGDSNHAPDAKLQLVNLILAERTPSKDFDGSWATTWRCADMGRAPGYTYEFRAQVRDGAFHGQYGIKDHPGSLELKGKIEPDGTAAFKGAVVVGSSIVGMGAARGTVSQVYAMAAFGRTSGSGDRINLRPCSLTFVKQ
jgi:TIR domain